MTAVPIDLERIRHQAREAAKFVADSLGTRVLEQDVPALIDEIERLRAMTWGGHVHGREDLPGIDPEESRP
jgi:hypothetical protein